MALPSENFKGKVNNYISEENIHKFLMVLSHGDQVRTCQTSSWLQPQGGTTSIKVAGWVHSHCVRRVGRISSHYSAQSIHSSRSGSHVPSLTHTCFPSNLGPAFIFSLDSLLLFLSLPWLIILSVSFKSTSFNLPFFLNPFSPIDARRRYNKKPQITGSQNSKY